MPDDLIDVQPEKDFFVYMLTKDILLQDCILDLLDNTVDGVNEFHVRKRRINIDEDKRYKGFHVEIRLKSSEFEIKDNCGGITLEKAKNHAFKLGKWKEIQDTGHTIGLYGIGMKRAMFKMGTRLEVKSSTDRDSFVISLDIKKWLKTKEWKIPLLESRAGRPGTAILVRSLYPNVAADFGTDKFANELIAAISRDYVFILEKKLKVSVNGTVVPPLEMEFLQRAEGKQKIIPLRTVEKINDVTIEIVAGMTDLPPEDDTAETPSRNAERYGWYVVCNDRVVLAGDKSIRTGWGDTTRVWHPQYAGFMGVARFNAKDPAKLPWTTTKRDIDPRNQAYQRALVLMKDAARDYASYTSKRKAHLDTAKAIESKAALIHFSKVQRRESMVFPIFSSKAKPTVRISYTKLRPEFEEVVSALGDGQLSSKQVGEKTFDYYYKREVRG